MWVDVWSVWDAAADTAAVAVGDHFDPTMLLINGGR